jgi:hypothetical protein
MLGVAGRCSDAPARSPSTSCYFMYHVGRERSALLRNGESPSVVVLPPRSGAGHLPRVSTTCPQRASRPPPLAPITTVPARPAIWFGDTLTRASLSCAKSRAGRCRGQLRRRRAAGPSPTNRVEEESGGRRRSYGGSSGGIGLGGILVIVGVVLTIVSSFWLGLVVTLMGLIAFGGLREGKWY